MLAHVDGVVHRDGAWGHTKRQKVSKNMAGKQIWICSDELTDLFRDERSASIATKFASISSEAVPSEASAIEASISITIGHVGELEAIVGVGEMAVGVAVGEPMSLRNTHNAQPPELL